MTTVESLLRRANTFNSPDLAIALNTAVKISGVKETAALDHETLDELQQAMYEVNEQPRDRVADFLQMMMAPSKSGSSNPLENRLRYLERLANTIEGNATVSEEVLALGDSLLEMKREQLKKLHTTLT